MLWRPLIFVSRHLHEDVVALSHEDELLLLFALSECVEAHLEQGAVAILFEPENGHICSQDEFLVLVGLLPGLDVGAKLVESLPSHLEQREAHLVERDTLELGLCEGARQDVKPHLAIHSLTEVDPFLERLRQFVRIRLPHELLDSLVSEFGKVLGISPDSEGSLDI